LQSHQGNIVSVSIKFGCIKMTMSIYKHAD
jgi:hypothetical protein